MCHELIYNKNTNYLNNQKIKQWIKDNYIVYYKNISINFEDLQTKQKYANKWTFAQYWSNSCISLANLYVFNMEKRFG